MMKPEIKLIIRSLSKLTRRPIGGGQQANFYLGLKTKWIHSALDIIHSLIEWRFECDRLLLAAASVCLSSLILAVRLTLLELMCFKLFQLSYYYVCFCYGSSVHENNYDASCRQKQFHTTWSQNTLQIFELAKSEDCYFSCIKLALQKVSVSHKNKSGQEISTVPFELVC